MYMEARKNGFSKSKILLAPIHTQQCVQVETAFQLYSIIFYLWPGGRIILYSIILYSIISYLWPGARSLRWQKWAEVAP